MQVEVDDLKKLTGIRRYFGDDTSDVGVVQIDPGGRMAASR